MRFDEFAPQPRPVLKISQQQQARQTEIRANTPATRFPTNQQPTPAPAPKPVKVHPKQWQHEWIQKYLAALIARDSQTVQPTEVDIVKAQMRYADAQRQANQDYEREHGESDDELGWQDEHRWVKRD